MEAALSCGMAPTTLFRRVVFPQLWRASVAPLASEMTILIKGTPAIAVIGVVEITRAASRVGAETYEPLPPFLAATAIYTLLIVVIVRLQRLLESRIAKALSETAP
jgi:ABC-type amino acid transport system permease subunit